ncbi:AcrR family transcriptional regulator [Nitrobacteraceae bacterium AZCC 2161]
MSATGALSEFFPEPKDVARVIPAVAYYWAFAHLLHRRWRLSTGTWLFQARRLESADSNIGIRNDHAGQKEKSHDARDDQAEAAAARPPGDREQQILAGAISYFAERGFDGPTRELTSRLGVSKGLLYRYFPGKDALIDRVYEEVFLGRWDVRWDTLLADRSIKLRHRLNSFYVQYADKMLHNYEWVRIYLLSGLAGASINKRFGNFIMEHVYKPVRTSFGTNLRYMISSNVRYPSAKWN